MIVPVTQSSLRIPCNTGIPRRGKGSWPSWPRITPLGRATAALGRPLQLKEKI